MADKYFSGKSGSVTIGSSSPTTIAVKNWKLTDQSQELDVTSTTSSGFYEVQDGINKLEGSFQADWDATHSPTSQAIVPCTKVANLNLAVSATGPTQYTITSAFIKSVEPELAVDGVVSYTCNFVSDGSYTRPS